MRNLKTRNALVGLVLCTACLSLPVDLGPTSSKPKVPPKRNVQSARATGICTPIVISGIGVNGHPAPDGSKLIVTDETGNESTCITENAACMVCVFLSSSNIGFSIREQNVPPAEATAYLQTEITVKKGRGHAVPH